MIKRIGECKRCSCCCRSFILLAGAMSDFKRAQEKYGLKLILNSDKKTYRCNMLIKNRCRIHKDKPKACREAPRMPFPWKCGFKFVTIDTKQKDTASSKEAFNFFKNLPKIKKIDEHTQQILEEGRYES